MRAGLAALRLLRYRPMFVGLTTVTLATGIAAGISTARLYDRALLRSLPYERAHALVSVGGVRINYAANFVAVAPEYRLREFAAMGLYQAGAVNFGDGDRHTRVSTAVVDGGFFATLGITPVTGRTLSDDDQGIRRAVVSAEWWQSIGRERTIETNNIILLNGEAFVVIGLIPHVLAFPWGTRIWIPPQALPFVTGRPFIPRLIGRLAANVSPRDASAAVNRVRGVVTHPGQEPLVVPLTTEVGEAIRPALMVLAVLIGALFVATFVNVAALWMFRLESRQSEHATRVALGASRKRLLLHHASEAMPVTVVAVSMGFIWAVWMVRGMAATFPELAIVVGLTNVDLDFVTIGGATLLLSVASFVVAPGILAAARLAPRAPYRGARITRVIQAGLVVAQIALATALTGALVALFTTVASLTRVDLGFRNPEAVVVQMTLPASRYSDPAAIVEFVRAVEEHAAAQSGARVGAASLGPGDTTFSTGVRLSRTRDQGPFSMLSIAATPGYFNAVGLPMIAGGGFTLAADSRRGVVVLTEAAARLLTAEPATLIGQSVFVDREAVGVVGIVASPRFMGPSSRPLGLTRELACHERGKRDLTPVRCGAT